MAQGASLKLVNVAKHFTHHQVLKSVQLEVAPSEFVAIVGRSGCGKSTLLRLIAGLEPPSQGEIYIDDRRLHRLNPVARVMFQDGRLLPWKRVLDNVGLGLRGNWKPYATAALQQVGLANRSQDWISVLSGGQRQRVALARALVSNPQLLLLDEPLGALDALTRIEMQRLIESLWLDQKFTALLVTHDVEEAVNLADRVLLIEQGQIVLDLPIPLPRPRYRGSSAFTALVEQILDQVLGTSRNSPLQHAEASLDSLASPMVTQPLLW
jgi:sulfonate transport system ATP-binding protein